MKKKLPRGNVYDELIDNYSVSIATTVIRKKLYLKSKKNLTKGFQ